MDPKRPKLCSLETDSADNEVDILQPSEVGISTFVQPLVEGFEATLKNRWEDFIVREFRGQNYARLTDLTPIPDPTPEANDFIMEKKLEVHLSGLQNLSRGDIEVLKIKAPDNKADRTQIHQAIRALFPSLESTTSQEGNENMIVVHRKDHPEAKGSRQSRRANGMSKSAPYCHFVLYKEGKDTLSAIQVLSRFLHVGPSTFSFAGTKDRRAITTQFVTAKGINSKTLSLLNTRLHGLRLGNFSYVSSPLFLGDLDGNQFVVVLRSVCAPRSVIETAVGAWKSTGFVNYYGLQRFGHSSKSKSFEIGKYLIRSKWADAIDLILKPTYADLPFLRKVKEKFLQSGDAKGCADDCPLGIEKTLLLGIAKYGKTLKAIQMLPRNLRQLYVHSYQSFLWNHVASLRMTHQNPGDLFAKPGDLYYNVQNVITPDNCEDDINFDDSVLETNESAISSANSLPSSKLSFIHPLVVGENEKIPLNSVVLPVPGYAVHYPKNHNFALPGSYRKLIVVPENVKYEFHEYSNPGIPLVKSDLQILNGTITNNVLTSASQNETQNNDICLDKDEKKQAVVLTFDLPKSSYATMAIRELTKTVIEKK
ncbi:tRNA pseudouridine synthase D, putative [Schistosoma mansoni]|uniref:tRNA pseudouridine synthase D, putative n=1 Tax=Schistosoma mansoni TaxID=6183 RepID=UPI00022C82BF|nr:tRNA pseudouridine synthase D, putative [Schistosoma mansoni]|eukprot:XP_018645272.1 tRNA pseudouridine synthase D, putative [Schistosoma mansoni]